MALSILFSKMFATFSYRNFIFILPPYYILIASGVVRLKKYRYIPIAFFILLSSLSLVNYYKNIFPYPENFYRPGVHAKKDNRGAALYINSHIKEGDIVIHTCNSTILPYIYYTCRYKNIDSPKDFIANLYKRPIEKDNWFISLGSKFLVRSETEIAKFITPDTKRIWLVLSYWEPQLLFLDGSMQLSENRAKRWMDDNFRIINYKEFTGIKVFLYQI